MCAAQKSGKQNLRNIKWEEGEMPAFSQRRSIPRRITEGIKENRDEVPSEAEPYNSRPKEPRRRWKEKSPESKKYIESN
jgi:hypothetical protein